MKTNLLCAMVLGLSAGGACDKHPEPTSSAPPPTSRPAATATAQTSATAATPSPAAKPGDLAWDAPAAWQKAENPSAMRKATYKVPKAAGDPEDAELSVSTAGGSTEANITRWEGQFSEHKGETKKEQKTVGDLKITIVDIRGKFSGSGMPGQPAAGEKANWAMLAAIVETNPPHFFKLTGPDKTVTAARADFDKLIDSLRAK